MNASDFCCPTPTGIRLWKHGVLKSRVSHRNYKSMGGDPLSVGTFVCARNTGGRHTDLNSRFGGIITLEAWKWPQGWHVHSPGDGKCNRAGLSLSKPHGWCSLWNSRGSHIHFWHNNAPRHGKWDLEKAENLKPLLRLCLTTWEVL